MTDRIRTLTVILDDDYRDDDAADIIRAIAMIKGVTSVVALAPISVGEYVARDIARRELRERLWALLSDPTVP